MIIIAVDDEKAALSLLSDYIKCAEHDAEVFSFLLSSEALKFAECNHIDIAFLDIDIPQINGIELAQRLKEFNPNINIIFVTAYSEYGVEAVNIRASGYILKPVNIHMIEKELKRLLYECGPQKYEIYAFTFGNFELYSDNKPIVFSRSKSKEMLAYLIDRKGCGLTKREIAAVIFEDKPYDSGCQDYMNKIINSLYQSLKKVNAENILIKKRNYYAVDTSQFKCDLYDYYNEDPETIKNFQGEYMEQYSWGEFTLGNLYNLK